MTRAELAVQALKVACTAHPDQRVCQVIVNALGEDPFYVEDAEAAQRLYRYASLAPNGRSRRGRRR